MDASNKSRHLRPNRFYTRWMVTRIAITLLFILMAMGLKAEPSDVLVGDLTFVRPESWKWEPPTNNSAAETRYVIPAANGGPALTDIRFYVEPRESRHSNKAWKDLFPKSRLADVREEQKTIGTRKCNYLTIKGTYIGSRAHPKPRPNFLLISATIPFGDQVIRARILGPEREVRPAAADFKRMVETALKESE